MKKGKKYYIKIPISGQITEVISLFSPKTIIKARTNRAFNLIILKLLNRDDSLGGGDDGHQLVVRQLFRKLKLEYCA